jgi:hypothetical protein
MTKLTKKEYEELMQTRKTPIYKLLVALFYLGGLAIGLLFDVFIVWAIFKIFGVL